MKSDSIIIEGCFSGNTVKSPSLNSFQCKCDTVIDLQWKIRNLLGIRVYNLDCPINCFFRVIPLQDTPTGDLSLSDPDQIMFVGTQDLRIEKIMPEQTFSLDMKVMFSTVGNFKIISHVERIPEKRVMVTKKKYEVPDIVLDDIDSITWFKGVKMSVQE